MRSAEGRGGARVGGLCAAQPEIKKFIIKARADVNETLANVNFLNANDSSSVCRSGNLPTGGVSTCDAVTAVGSPGYRIVGNASVGNPPIVPNGPISVSGLPQAVTVTFGILVW